ncbi:MAG TPA: hypothetical protein VKR82_04250 [Candidatus Acidoferrales bacterium]|nr:hypothetical protein [Candidatus Acidoferrales bacterium]
MELLTGKQAASRIQGMLSAKYQVHGYWVDLTIRGLSGVDPVGRLDFGGGEYAPAGQVTIAPKRLRPEDNYQWWELDRGCYIIEFNETLELADNEIALLEPDPRTLRTGATHVPVFLRGRVSPLDTLFDVQAQHLTVKQNARVSRLRVFRLGTDGKSAVSIARVTAKPGRKARKKK